MEIFECFDFEIPGAGCPHCGVWCILQNFGLPLGNQADPDQHKTTLPEAIASELSYFCS